MICIGERVKRAIDDMQQEKFLFALEQVSIAIDMTAKKYYQKPISSRTIFKNLLKEYYWLLELMAFTGINTEKSIFGNFPFKAGRDEYLEPTFHDLAYHVIRCGLIHGDKIDIRFHMSDTMVIAKDFLILPSRLVWALLGIVVFCKANKNEQTSDGYYLSVFDQHYTINGWWGMDDLIRARFQDRITNNPRVILNIPHKHFHDQSGDRDSKE